jgi:competence protein ComEA
MDRRRWLDGLRWGIALVALSIGALALQQVVRATPGATIVFSREEAPRRTIAVHVSGAVEREGVVSLPDGARTSDALAAAGGATTDADLATLNLALRLRDEQQVHVPRRGERAVAAVAVLDLNRATQRELEALPGIGVARARAIIAWRETNGPFLRAEDLVTHRLIPQSVFAAIRERVGVG